MQSYFSPSILRYLALALIIFGMAGLSSAAETGIAGSSVVRDISMANNSIQIKVEGPIKYAISKPADPFMVVVELSGTSIGQFKDKIISTVPGITEIIPTQVETPNYAARLTILLQSPVEIKADVNGDMLVLSLDKSAEAAASGRAMKAAAPKSGGAFAKAITDIALDKDGDTVELIIKADGKLMEPVVYQLDSTLSLEIPGVSMKASIPSKLPSVLKDMKVRTEQDRLKFDVILADKMTTEVYVLDDEIVVDVLAKDKKVKKAASEKGAEPQEKVVNGNKVISLDFQDADIVPILRLLGDVGGYNIVVHPDVKGKITMKLMNVPWNQAMDIILKTFNLEKVVEGNIIRIATVKAFQEEKKSMAENKELFGKAEDIVTKVFTINYANVDKVREAIDKGKILSPRGTMSVDIRTRALIVKDIQPSIDEVQKLLNSIDKPTQQVLIEARIVEMNTNYAKSLGVDWGLRAFSSATVPNSLIHAGGSTGQGTGSGGSVPGGGVLVVDPNTGSTIKTISVPSIINLPAATATKQATSALTLGFLNRAQTFGLDLRLSAVEDIGNAKIISSPKILTLDNQEAIIKQGQRIPVTTLQSGTGGGAATFSTTYIDALLKLVVTPQISPDGTILLKVEIDKDQPNLSIRDSQGNPAIDTKQAITQVVLRDGETIVIGGILTSDEEKQDSEVPGLAKLPVLGWLFKQKTNTVTTTEMLIFVTPRLAQ